MKVENDQLHLVTPNYQIRKSKFKMKHAGFEQINECYAQAGQDLFVLGILEGKSNGTYLEIGCGEPKSYSNTYLLEQQFGWKGVSLDIEDSIVQSYNLSRKNKAVVSDATTVDYLDLLEKSGIHTRDLDFASIDCEPASNTYAALRALPLDVLRFAVITYEHDCYYAGPKFKYSSRNYLWSHGYVLVASNISAGDAGTGNLEYVDYEDWWVHPELVDMNRVSRFFSNSDDTKFFMSYLFDNIHES